MTFELNAAFSLSVGIGAVISWIRFKKADPAYFPFFVLLTTGFFSEIISIVIMTRGYSNILLYNAFSLLEAIVITWQFRRWQMFGKNKTVYYAFQLSYIIILGTELMLRGSIYAFGSFFIICYSTAIVFIAIGIINRVIFRESAPLIQNPMFLICMGFIVYFTYMALIEIFWVYG